MSHDVWQQENARRSETFYHSMRHLRSSGVSSLICDYAARDLCREFNDHVRTGGLDFTSEQQHWITTVARAFTNRGSEALPKVPRRRGTTTALLVIAVAVATVGGRDALWITNSQRAADSLKRNLALHCQERLADKLTIHANNPGRLMLASREPYAVRITFRIETLGSLRAAAGSRGYAMRDSFIFADLDECNEMGLWETLFAAAASGIVPREVCDAVTSMDSRVPHGALNNLLDKLLADEHWLRLIYFGTTEPPTNAKMQCLFGFPPQYTIKAFTPRTVLRWDPATRNIRLFTDALLV